MCSSAMYSFKSIYEASMGEFECKVKNNNRICQARHLNTMNRSQYIPTNLQCTAIVLMHGRTNPCLTA
jgi:hypothetical protein